MTDLMNEDKVSRIKDLTDQRFDRLVVIDFERYRTKSGDSRVKWNCVCDCGSRVTVRGCALQSGATKSCGCLKRERSSEVNKTLGMSKTRVYSIWCDMKRRCNNKNNKYYDNYGGRGIRYDPKWETFEGFWEDMEEGYEAHLTLDREDNNNGYCKDNCRWVTISTQNKNLRMRVTNTSGKTGVSFINSGDGLLKGYAATWYTIKGEKRAKGFYISKYGKEEAFRLACEYRDEQIRLLNEQGAGYTEGHGG